MKRLYIAEMIEPWVNANRFRIIEKVNTIDGPRDRITNISFSTLEEAKAFVKAVEK